ncbi:phosphatidylinositol-specific phospholipase C [Paenibacillus tarimensis]|uniref:phosphatidylinositol-specific phospholipase C n=1 Tax=Paenibacillus tarimensis TaxID=416012 RepID=UPI001F3C1377|nr:phosphatidylinositol-specific phospholipase C [Paenibacillus tarimensis]MCF2945414.1 phosphatidylinositol-specific phospholipase C [Paenibacillus tarimensis]
MFKKAFLLVAAVTMVVSSFAGTALAYSSTNWMGSVKDSVSLAALSIPGTHDSGALYEPISGTAKTQELTIAQQLSIGVRYLDIRTRHYKDAFPIHHGAVYQNQNFDDVLNAVISFLNANPSETVIMSVKEEHTPADNTRSYEETFNWYVNKNRDKWLLTDRIPTLGEARGKIVLLRRFGAAQLPKGINATSWQENTTFTIQNAAALKVQDYYKVTDRNKKWTDIQSMYNEASTSNPSRLYINFTSGYSPGLFGIPNIRAISNEINPKVSQFFSASTKGRFGISVMDFITSDHASKIIATNF